MRTPRDAKKVGVLFGVLYTFSPILWMLPPMIYRVFEPGLSGLENENAYLLMCKQTRPAGTDNNNSIRIIGAGAAISGCFISLIALLSGGETLVLLTTGIVLTVLGGLIFLTTKNK